MGSGKYICSHLRTVQVMFSMNIIAPYLIRVIFKCRTLFPQCTRTRLLLISARSAPSVKPPFLTRSLIMLPLKSVRYPASTAARFTLELQASTAARFTLRLQSPRRVPYSTADASRCQRTTRPGSEPFLFESQFDIEYQLPIFMYCFSWQVVF